MVETRKITDKSEESQLNLICVNRGVKKMLIILQDYYLKEIDGDIAEVHGEFEKETGRKLSCLWERKPEEENDVNFRSKKILQTWNSNDIL